jgi:hypothetical protein
MQHRKTILPDHLKKKEGLPAPKLGCLLGKFFFVAKKDQTYAIWNLKSEI